MKILIDMNLSPAWVDVLQEAGFDAVHWSRVGAPDAPDRELFAWARRQGYVVFTHDLDFGAILAATNASGPSVVQVRTQEVSPAILGPYLAATLERFATELTSGALVTVDRDRSRARLLPLHTTQAGDLG